MACDFLLDEALVELTDEAGLPITSEASCQGTVCDELLDEALVALTDEAGIAITSEADCTDAVVSSPPDDIHPTPPQTRRGSLREQVVIQSESLVRVKITSLAKVRRIDRGDDDMLLLY